MSSAQISNDLILEMANQGVLTGHKKSKTHPKMKQYIGATRNEIEILKPEVAIGTLEKAIEILKEIINKKGLIIFVGTEPAAHESILKLAGVLGQPHVITRWLGGTLTNFPIIKERLNYYQNLKLRKERGELAKYTKKEQSLFGKELNKLSIKFEGLVKLERLPDAIFIINGKSHETAVREAKRTNIPIIAMIDTNDNPEGINFPIIANDHAKASIVWIVDRILEKIEINSTLIANDGNNPEIA